MPPILQSMLSNNMVQPFLDDKQKNILLTTSIYQK